MSYRMARNDLLMIRMAAEGIPIAAISRVAIVSFALARVTLEAAKSRGHLAELPPDEWTNPLRMERPVRTLPVEQIIALADEVQTLGLTAAQSRLAAAIAVCGMISRAEAFPIVCVDQNAMPKTVDVVLCKARQKLAPYGVTIDGLWGRGYRMNEVSRLKLMSAIGTLEQRRAS